MFDFSKFAGLDVVDEAADRDVGDEGVMLDAGDLAADVALKIGEGMEVSGADGGGPGFFF